MVVVVVQVVVLVVQVEVQVVVGVGGSIPAWASQWRVSPLWSQRTITLPWQRWSTGNLGDLPLPGSPPNVSMLLSIVGCWRQHWNRQWAAHLVLTERVGATPRDNKQQESPTSDHTPQKTFSVPERSDCAGTPGPSARRDDQLTHEEKQKHGVSGRRRRPGSLK